MKIDGFSFSAVDAGIRYADRLDLALIHADSPCVTAGVFTSSQVKAAPVLIDIERLQKDRLSQTILINSGNANACTGENGITTALATSDIVAKQLGISPEKVLLASTGVIGEQLNITAFEKGIPDLIAQLSRDGFADVSRAIMTTDTTPKVAKRKAVVDTTPITLVGMAKGSGMIMPNMATMLAFILTDAAITPASLQQALKKGVDQTFNRITVDGDTSTNDMALAMASAAAGNKEIATVADGDGRCFAETLKDLLVELAVKIVADGEGATKTVTVRVEQASSSSEAELLARTVANSPLVKTAFFGEDANWGRIFMALGRAGVEFDPARVDLFFDDVQLVAGGTGLGREAEERATTVLKKKDFTLTVKMGQGRESAEIYTCDFSIDYIRINADYRS
ncbi:MAG: bifunctional ornithine acetyltransferase/N-acetylglutamate synthase [Deltaproteobacteria bacterium]|nr:MAG: bifunctional ornithine acetyltransferase/N-acetylglutamate synthase [Deltaproteobacteria bacterium]